MSRVSNETRSFATELDEYVTGQKENRPKKSSKEYIRLLLTQLKTVKEQLDQLRERDLRNTGRIEALQAENQALQGLRLKGVVGEIVDQEQTIKYQYDSKEGLAGVKTEYERRLADLQAAHDQAIETYRRKITELLELLKLEREKTQKATLAVKKAIENKKLTGLDMSKGICQQLSYFRQLLHELRDMNQSIAVKMPIVLAKNIEVQVKSFIKQNTAELEAKNNKLLKDNRRLQEELVTLRGDIRVICKIRQPMENRQCLSVKEDVIETISPLEVNSRKWKFDAVLDDSNKSISEHVVPVTTGLLEGFNVSILALGQSGTGKTTTMEGTEGEPGVYISVIRSLFTEIGRRQPEMDVSLKLSMLEVYNHKLNDLLSPVDRKLSVANDESGESTVLNLSTHSVQNLSQFQYLLTSALPRRKVGSSYLNTESSRSHFILTVHCAVNNNLNHKSFQTKLQFVDLAGAERLAKSGSEGVRLKEAKHINQSLFSLSEVLTAKQQSFVPYRNSLLTQILHDTLSRNSRVIVLVHVSPDASDYGETQSTLEFSMRCRQTYLS